MTTHRVARFLAIAGLFVVWGCTSNQYVTNNYGTDDLYGEAETPVRVAQGRQGQDTDRDRNSNPDFQYGAEDAIAGSEADYYDDSYLSVRNLRRNVSDRVGYAAGFDDGYYAGRSSAWNPYFSSAFWPTFGLGTSLYMGWNWGFGSSLRYGYNPWGYYGGGFYNPYYSSWADPYWSGYGFYGPYYNRWGYGGFSPWNYYPVVVINNGDYRTNRTYGARGAVSPGTRAGSNSVAAGTPSAAASPRRGSASAPAAGSSSRGAYYSGRGTSAPNTNGEYYSRPRGSSSAYTNANPAVSTPRSYSRSGGSAASGSEGNYYYSQPRSTGRSLSTGNNTIQSGRSGSYERSEGYSRPSTTRSYNSNTPSYSAPARSSTPSPSYSAPSRSSSPSPSYSAPSRGGGSSSPSRGPR